MRATGEHGLHILDIEGRIVGAKPLFADKDFYEVEVARRMDVFGKIAQAFSTYECRWEKDGAAFMTGINSIQLLQKDGRGGSSTCSGTTRPRTTRSLLPTGPEPPASPAV